MHSSHNYQIINHDSQLVVLPHSRALHRHCIHFWRDDSRVLPHRDNERFWSTLPVRQSPEAKSCFTIFSSRDTVIGMELYAFYFTNRLDAMDMLLAVQVYGGAIMG